MSGVQAGLSDTHAHSGISYKLELIGVNYSYDNAPVLSDVNLRIPDRQFVSIIGPSGCGKSTLLHIISGLLPVSDASVLVDGKPASISHFAYMPQDDLLMPWRTVLRNACLYAEIAGKDLAQAKKEAMELLTTFGLEGTENLYPGQLSGGMRQRAAFLRTFLCQADIFLLDEPFGALDALTRGKMQEWLTSVRDILKRTTLLVTHDIDEAILLSDRILLLSGIPATFIADYPIDDPPSIRDREWLLRQTDLKRAIHERL